jgi:hypothetical protein
LANKEFLWQPFNACFPDVNMVKAAKTLLPTQEAPLCAVEQTPCSEIIVLEN